MPARTSTLRPPMMPDLPSLLRDAARRWRAGAYLLGFVALTLAAFASPSARALEQLEQFPHSVLNIHTRQGAEWFSVWIANTPARSEQGLMFLRWLPADQGMLFPQDVPRVMRMWMKNTLIPLDMLFIDAHSRVVYIQERATPQSENIISAAVP